MPKVSLQIHGRTYDLACDEGQEDQLKELAGYVNRRMKELQSTVGDIGELRLLVMTSLLIADELSDCLKREGLELGEEIPSDDNPIAQNMEWTADRIEAIAARLEAS